jgi:hypothetical protein
MADRAGWQHALEAELRAAGRQLDVPRAGDPTVAVRQRLGGRAAGRRRGPVPGAGLLRRPTWRAVLVVAVAFLAALVATPQGRAVIGHVLRFAGVEVRQEPGPRLPPGGGGSLPGQRRESLDQARREAAFPVLVPAALGRPAEVLVSDHGRVVSLIYRRAPHGLMRLDEYAGLVSPSIFEKFVRLSQVTAVEVNHTQGLWIRGPHELVYIGRDGTPVVASARLTTGNTLIWGTGQAALRLEGNVGKTTALAIADSAR